MANMKAPQAQANPLLTVYDEAIHAVTEKHRKAHPHIWYAVDSTHIQEAHKPAPKLAAPKVTTPMLEAFLADLDSVTARFTGEHKDWTFFYKGAKAQSLMKAGTIKHDTQPMLPKAG